MLGKRAVRDAGSDLPSRTEEGQSSATCEVRVKIWLMEAQCVF